MPVASFNQRNQAQKDSISRPDRRAKAVARTGPGDRPQTRTAAATLFVFVARFLRKLGGLDAPLRFEPLDDARLVPFHHGLRQHIAEALLALLDRESPRNEKNRIERHLVATPLGLLHFTDDGGVVIRKRGAVAVLERGIGFRGPRKSNAVDAIFLLQLLVVERALDEADLFAAKRLPALETRRLRRQDIGAGTVVARIHDVDGLPALRRIAHGRDHDVDLALLQELNAVGGNHRHQLQLDAETLGYVGGEIGLEADDLAGWVEKTERPVVSLGANGQC